MSQGTFPFDDGADKRPRHIRARDEAMRLVEKNAERARAKFREDARAFVLEFLRYGESPGEAITLACKEAGIVPHDDRAFGPVYFALCRADLIEKVGVCRRKRGHGTAGGNVWALKKPALPRPQPPSWATP